MAHLTRRLLLSALTAAALTTAVPAVAQSNKNNFNQFIVPPTFGAADKARIDRATAYLQNLATATGRFEQSDYRGRKTTGTWYLSRPGRIRFEYDAPYSLLLVSNGTTVGKWDPRLKTFDTFPLDQTPLSLFLSKQIRFDRGVIITEVTSNTSSFTIKARDRRRSTEGYVVLHFSQAPGGAVTLTEWTIVDAQSRPTTVRLVGLKTGVPVASSLFVVKDPRIVR